MTVIKWRDSYNTGVAQFDLEHHKIVELIDLMYVAIRDKRGKEVVVQACNDVLLFTEYHFANEEKALKAVNYPGLQEQIAEHAHLKEQAAKIQLDIDTDFAKGAHELYRFLYDWLVDHILNCDKKYGPYLDDRQDLDIPIDFRT